MRSQASQVFIYVLTIVIASFILFYGYKAIFSFNEKSEQIAFIQFKSDMENSLKALSLDFGSVNVKEFSLPENINIVCFARNYPDFPVLSDTGYPVIEDSVNSGVRKNIFLIGNNVEESFYAEKISSDEDLLCINALSNKIKVRMEGRGDYTFLSAG